MNLAFKNSALSDSLFSKAISWKTGSPFCHVELWMAGPREHAVCFSSREPRGTGYAILDLSPPLYTCIEIQATESELTAVRWFAEGTGFRRYDWVGILGFVAKFGEYDPARVVCSGWCTLVLQRCLGLFPNVNAWNTNPGQLYELASVLPVRAV